MFPLKARAIPRNGVVRLIYGLEASLFVASAKTFELGAMFATRNKKLLGAPGIATRSKDATRGSWPYY